MTEELPEWLIEAINKQIAIKQVPLYHCGSTLNPADCRVIEHEIKMLEWVLSLKPEHKPL